MAKFLIETALLTHGLVSIDEAELISQWPFQEENLVWVEEGRIRIGTLNDYLPIRRRAEKIIRVDRDILQRSLENKEDGCLTASGTMAVAERLGIPLAVTAGMGGISNYIKGEELCPDLPALVESKTALIATSPKDVVDIPATIQWILNHGVKVFGARESYCSGFMFSGEKIPLTGQFPIGSAIHSGTLILQGIPEEERIPKADILEKALEAGLQAQEKGAYFHPAANAMIDQLSKGKSSRLQLHSLIENAVLAAKL